MTGAWCMRLDLRLPLPPLQLRRRQHQAIRSDVPLCKRAGVEWLWHALLHYRLSCTYTPSLCTHCPRHTPSQRAWSASAALSGSSDADNGDRAGTGATSHKNNPNSEAFRKRRTHTLPQVNLAAASASHTSTLYQPPVRALPLNIKLFLALKCWRQKAPPHPAADKGPSRDPVCSASPPASASRRMPVGVAADRRAHRPCRYALQTAQD